MGGLRGMSSPGHRAGATEKNKMQPPRKPFSPLPTSIWPQPGFAEGPRSVGLSWAGQGRWAL